MSVYTTISPEELVDLLSQYDVGELQDYRGISDGIENTNYFVDTDRARFVLTIFEQHDFEEMQYFLNLMHHLADRGVPSANPVADNQGQYLRQFKHKPAALVERLKGGSITEPQLAHCRQIGVALGKLHSAGLHFDVQRPNPRGAEWRAETAAQVSPCIDAEQQALLRAEVAFEAGLPEIALPAGVVHADLFRDNALWDGDQLSGLIDFYYACHDKLLYDLAVTVNDWCNRDDYSLDRERTVALLQSYHAHRAFSAEEQALWPAMLRAAALRFWCSRLFDKHFPRDGEIVTQHNPDEFYTILQDRSRHHDRYRDYWIS